jgi:feruloyl-CoA synthase
MRDISIRKLNRPTPRVQLRRGDGGVTYVNCGLPYEPGLATLIDYLLRAAQLRPDTTFLAERVPSGEWRSLTYTAAVRDSAAIATWLIREGFGPDSAPVMILSENSIEHALLMLGVLRAGAAVVPVSPSYSFGSDLSRLEYALELIRPGLVFAADATRYASALALCQSPQRRTISAVEFPQLLAQVDEAAVSRRRALINESTIAKIMLTSGSTGHPKGVINTHANVAGSVQMIRQVMEPYDPDNTYTVVDWLPWHHTFGGNGQLNTVIANAGTLYIDQGRPLPGMFDPTIRNLKEVSPTGFACVPAAFEMLAGALERDGDLRRVFFKRLRWLGYGGALLPQPTWERVQRLAEQELGERLPFDTGWGMTETTSTGISVYWSTARTGLLGLPQPGVTLKLVPLAERMELRIKGPNVMSGYFHNQALNAAAFDEEGYFRTGDTVRWADPSIPNEGLEYTGRMAEDFKLISGTWVQGSLIRRDLVAALQPHVADAVICAPDHPWLGALVWLTAPDDANVRADLAHKLKQFNASRRGSADRIARVLILQTPPSAEAGEITDKRSVNQRRVLERRADDVERLYAAPTEPRLIVANL